MVQIFCEYCKKPFMGRPNRCYCSIACRRKTEMTERKRKKEARYKAWLTSLSPEERAFWESIPEFPWGSLSATAETDKHLTLRGYNPLLCTDNVTVGGFRR